MNKSIYHLFLFETKTEEFVLLFQKKKMLAWYKEEHPLIYNISIFPLVVTEIALADATFFINVDKITLVMYAMWIFFLSVSIVNYLKKDLNSKVDLKTLCNTSYIWKLCSLLEFKMVYFYENNFAPRASFIFHLIVVDLSYILVY